MVPHGPHRITDSQMSHFFLYNYVLFPEVDVLIVFGFDFLFFFSFFVNLFLGPPGILSFSGRNKTLLPSHGHENLREGD